jgi:hypothetical protein
MRNLLRILALLHAPALLGVVSAFVSLLGYWAFGGNPELPPLFVDASEWLFRLAAIALPGLVTWPLWRKRHRLAYLALVVVLVPYSFIRVATTQDEVLSFLGIDCCRESHATLANALDMTFNPMAPWVMVTRTGWL